MQLLKKALEEGDWVKVATVYEMLTGDMPDTIPVNHPNAPRIPTIDTIIEDLELLRDCDIGRPENFEDPVKPVAKKKRGRPKGSKTKKMKPASAKAQVMGDRTMAVTEVNTGKRNVQFVTGAEVTDEESKEKAMYKPPSERRDTYIPVKINCNKCGREYEINPAFIKPDPDVKGGGVYTCNGCQSRR